MCDYSIVSTRSRPARAGESVKTHDFGNGTSGFAPALDKRKFMNATAVCLLPGTEIAFLKSVQVKANLTPREAEVRGEKRVINMVPQGTDCTATFIQVNAGIEETHHDAVEFPDGSIVLVTCLQEGQEARIVTPPKRAQRARVRSSALA